MQEIQLTTSEAFLYFVVIPAGVGFLLGLVPLVAGLIRKKTKLGVLGLIFSILGGVFGFFGSIATMAIFTWLILRDRHVAEDALPDKEATNEPPDET